MPFCFFCGKTKEVAPAAMSGCFFFLLTAKETKLFSIPRCLCRTVLPSIKKTLFASFRFGCASRIVLLNVREKRLGCVLCFVLLLFFNSSRHFGIEAYLGTGIAFCKEVPAALQSRRQESLKKGLKKPYNRQWAKSSGEALKNLHSLPAYTRLG